MSFLKLIRRYKFFILIFLLVCFFAGYFVTEFFVNSYQASYVYCFKATQEEPNLILDEAFYTEVFKKIDENNQLAETDSTYKKISYAKIDYKEMLKTARLTSRNDRFELRIQKRFFPNIVSSTTGKVNPSLNRVKNYFNLILGYTEYDTSFETVELVDNHNPWIMGGIALGIGAALWLCSLSLYAFLGKEDEGRLEDNENIFTSIFHKSYWKESISFTKHVKKMCSISALFGCMLICKLLPIPSGFGSLGLGFTYLFFALICWIYGPVCGLFIGFCSDILGYFIHTSGVFFLGYTLDAMMAGFTYGVCFYKKRISFANCFIARVVVNLFVNVVLGAFWWKIIYSLDWDAYQTYIILTALPKNILYLLPQSILLFVFFKALARPLAAFGLIDQRISENIRLF